MSNPEEKHERRSLSSVSSQTLLATLATFVKKLQGDLQVDHSALRKGYICRSCMRLVLRYHAVQEELIQNINKALPLLPIVGTALQCDESSLASVAPGTASSSASGPASSLASGPASSSASGRHGTSSSPALTVSSAQT